MAELRRLLDEILGPADARRNETGLDFCFLFAMLSRPHRRVKPSPSRRQVREGVPVAGMGLERPSADSALDGAPQVSSASR